MSEFQPKSEPKTTFTFYPHNNEVEDISKLTEDKLVADVMLNIDGVVQYMHELWRTNRENEMYECLRKQEIRSQFLELFPSEGNGLLFATGEIHGAKRQDTRKFSDDVFVFLFKINLEIPVDQELPEPFLTFQKKSVDQFIVWVDYWKSVIEGASKAQNALKN